MLYAVVDIERVQQHLPHKTSNCWQKSRRKTIKTLEKSKLVPFGNCKGGSANSCKTALQEIIAGKITQPEHGSSMAMRLNISAAVSVISW
jgi:hypothetical protein